MQGKQRLTATVDTPVTADSTLRPLTPISGVGNAPLYFRASPGYMAGVRCVGFLFQPEVQCSTISP